MKSRGSGSRRMMGAYLSSVFINVIVPLLLLKLFGFSDYMTPAAYTEVELLFAVCSVPLFYFVYAKYRETVYAGTGAVKVPPRISVRNVLTNKQLMLIFVIQLVFMTAFFGRLGTVMLYLICDIQRTDLVFVFMSLPLLFTVIGIFATKNFVARMGRRKMAIFANVGAGAALIAIYITGSAVGYANIGLLLVLHCVYGFFCFSFPIPTAMTADAINDQEARTGIRSDGTAYAAVALAVNLGSVIGVSAGLLFMGAMGYKANAQQTAQTVQGINMTVNLVFGVLYLCCAILYLYYPLDKEAEKL